MNFLRRHSTEHMTLKMTAMIDVVFQLLIFFLVGTEFRVPEGELEAYLPDQGAPITLHQRDKTVDEIRVTLRVSQAGQDDPEAPPSVLLDDTAGGGGAIGGSYRWMRGRLATFAEDEQIRTEVPVIIEAEPLLPYHWVIDVLDHCKALGYKTVNFAASKRNAPLP